MAAGAECTFAPVINHRSSHMMRDRTAVLQVRCRAALPGGLARHAWAPARPRHASLYVQFPCCIALRPSHLTDVLSTTMGVVGILLSDKPTEHH